MTYENWIKEVDVLLEKYVFMDHMTVPDFLWKDLYNFNYTPQEAFEKWKADDMYGFLAL